MTRKRLLEDAIRRIAGLRGFEDAPLFNITPVSRDCAGIVIMGIRWPEGARLYGELKRAVRGFPEVADATCVALLPDVVDEIIATACTASVDSCRDDGVARSDQRPAQGAPIETPA